MDEIDRIKRRIRLTPSTLFLADFISKNYIHDRWSKRQEVNRLEMIDIAHASLFLASKLRERDIYCPMIPHILQAGGKPNLTLLTHLSCFLVFLTTFESSNRFR